MTQKILSPLFALLIFVTHLNCVLEHGLSCDGSSAAVVGQASLDFPFESPSPVQPDECHHDCICKGATLADQYIFESYELPAFGSDYLAIGWLTPSFVQQVERTLPQTRSRSSSCLLLRAIDRCAMLQTFLI